MKENADESSRVWNVCSGIRARRTWAFVSMMAISSCGKPPQSETVEKADNGKISSSDPLSKAAEQCAGAARVCALYTVSGNTAGAVDCMPDVALDSGGGRDAFIAIMDRSKKEMEKGGIAVVGSDISPPDRLVETKENMYAILKQTVRIRIPQGELVQKSFLIGRKEKSNPVWKFVDGAKLTSSSVKNLFPDFPDTLELPKVPEPELNP
jgi:hypothetical protein